MKTSVPEYQENGGLKFNTKDSVEETCKNCHHWMIDDYSYACSDCISNLFTTHTQQQIDENTSDGYHTFKDLYEFRLLYNAHLFNEWAKQGMYDVHKSQRHADGELCFGRADYFVVVATLPTGQISNHYPMSDWDLFKCEAVEKAKQIWDGHTSQDVVSRLRSLIIPLKERRLFTNGRGLG